MKEINPKFFHRLYGVKKPRINYQKKDFLDYTIMCVMCAFLVYFTYGPSHIMTKVGISLCALMIAAFSIRHGFEFSVPVILKRPQDVLYMIVYKIQNLKGPYLFAVGFLFLENYLIYLTPDLPHKVELMHEIAIYGFFLHFILITIYRTVILLDHLKKKELVSEILMQSSWKSFISRQPSITLEIIFAYLTGIWTHIILIAPWYLVITYFNFSILILPVAIFVNFATQLRFLRAHHNSCFYRDHWLGHNSEFEFLYLHGVHHDGIPSALIAVGENGPLEGFFRHAFGHPGAFFNPILVSILYTVEIRQDMYVHQYIPGIYPQLKKEERQVAQHSTHHYHRIEPYSLAVKLDQPQFSEEFIKKNKVFGDEINYAVRYDEQLTGFRWDNSRHKWFLDLCEKYDKWA